MENPDNYDIITNKSKTYKEKMDTINDILGDKYLTYYPESIIQKSKSNNKFNKFLTIQWRKVWPKGRKFQQRVLGNGIEIADKLALVLQEKNYLIRIKLSHGVWYGYRLETWFGRRYAILEPTLKIYGPQIMRDLYQFQEALRL